MVTVLTRTIGPSGRDYASFTLAEADVTNIGTSADLVANDEAIVFEADAGTYSESVTFSSALTTDATRNVTYKPAAGSEHRGVFGAGVNLSQVGTTPQIVNDHYLILDGIQITDNQFSVLPTWTGQNVVCRNLLVLLGETSSSWGLTLYTCGSTSDPLVVENCVFKIVDAVCGVYVRAFPSNSSMRVTNSTFHGNAANTSLRWYAASVVSQNSTSVSLDVINCLDLTGGQTYSDTTGSPPIVTGSNNFGGATSPFPVAIQGSPYPITATTDTDPGAGDWAIYQASNGQLYNIVANDVWQQGVGPTANSDVPATDILGYARYGATANPGAFELGLPVPGIRVKPRHFQVNTAATAHAVSVWQPQLRKL